MEFVGELSAEHLAGAIHLINFAVLLVLDSVELRLLAKVSNLGGNGILLELRKILAEDREMMIYEAVAQV